NVIRKLLLLASGYTINAAHVRIATATPPASKSDSNTQTLRDLASALLSAAERGEFPDARNRLVEAAEKEVITQAIERTHGNQLKAARLLGISRLTLREKLRQFGLRAASRDEDDGL